MPRHSGSHIYPPVTIAVLNYNGINLLPNTIQSIKELRYPARKTILVDDGSTDDSVSYVRNTHSDISIIEMGSNTKLLNLVRNTAISHANTNLVFITDNDITFDPDCLTALVEAMEELPNAAVMTPRVMYQNERDRIYIDYNQFHYVCSSIDKNRDRKVSELSSDLKEPRRSFGCGIMLLDKTKAKKVNFFDTGFVMGWGDDGEFHHRVNLSGMKCYAVPTALVYHKAIKGAPRIYGQHRNRWSIILQTYSWRTILIIAPALLTYESVLFFYSLLDGKAYIHLKALKDIMVNYRTILSKRREISAYKVVSDRELMVSDEFYVPQRYKNYFPVKIGLNVLNLILNIYWKLISRFV
jgi:GT2 family glycosyltransferase